LAGIAVIFRVVSGPTVGRTGQAITDAAGRASFSYAGANPGVDTLQATAVVSGETLSSNLAAVEWISLPTTLVYTGAQVGEYSDPMLLAARLTESTTGQPLAGRMLAFALGSQTATAVTGADGTATAEIVPTGLPGATLLAVAFAGEGTWSGSATSRLAVITPEDTVLILSGVSAVASGGAQAVSTRLVDDDGQPLVGRIVTFRLGTATATTGADGTATASLSFPILATGTQRDICMPMPRRREPVTSKQVDLRLRAAMSTTSVTQRMRPHSLQPQGLVLPKLSPARLPSVRLRRSRRWEPILVIAAVPGSPPARMLGRPHPPAGRRTDRIPGTPLPDGRAACCVFPKRSGWREAGSNHQDSSR
jgi:hypothetical protein